MFSIFVGNFEKKGKKGTPPLPPETWQKVLFLQKSCIQVDVDATMAAYNV